MTDKNIKDQEVTEEQGFNEADAAASNNDASCDNMAEDSEQATDTMAEESSAEEHTGAYTRGDYCRMAR